MTEILNDTNTFTIELTSGGETPKSETNWLIYIILAAIAAALLGAI